MLTLGIETATENVSVGLVNGRGQSWEVNRFCHYTLVRELMDMINELCQKAQTKITAIDHIAISIGPGSFTGLRIGLATAQGIAFSLNKPLVPVHTLDSLASQVTGDKYPIAVLQRARKNETYYALFERSKGILVKLVPEKVLAVDALPQEIKSPSLLIGNTVDMYRETLVRQLHTNAVFLPGTGILPSGRVVAQCGLANLEKNVPLAAIEPLYIKEPDAKLKEKSIHV